MVLKRTTWNGPHKLKSNTFLWMCYNPLLYYFKNCMKPALQYS